MRQPELIHLAVDTKDPDEILNRALERAIPELLRLEVRRELKE